MSNWHFSHKLHITKCSRRMSLLFQATQVTGFSACTLCPCPTHVLVGNDVWDVLQEQLGSFLVLVQFLEEHAGLEVPYKERHRFRDA